MCIGKSLRATVPIAQRKTARVRPADLVSFTNSREGRRRRNPEESWRPLSITVSEIPQFGAAAGRPSITIKLRKEVERFAIYFMREFDCPIQ
jgi:hypothetical protein